MVIIGCSYCGTKSSIEKLRINMKEILKQRGFVFVGSCHCHGFLSEWYELPSLQGWRMEIGGGRYWVKKKSGVANWSTIEGNPEIHFNSALEKFFKTN